MNTEGLYQTIVAHYEECLLKHGDNHLGVDWPKVEDVKTRYKVMLDLLSFRNKTSVKSSLLDFGCGASHLFEFMSQLKYKNVLYSGLDISPKFVDLSKLKFPSNQYFCLDILNNSDLLPRFDYIVMNGVFTEKRELTFDQMFEYFKLLLTAVFEKAEKGVAFNVMSKAVEWERWDLFHLPTDLLIDFITKKLTRNFVIRNDYGLYEYTTYIYK